jgi:hypothetical protein
MYFTKNTWRTRLLLEKSHYWQETVRVTVCAAAPLKVGLVKTACNCQNVFMFCVPGIVVKDAGDYTKITLLPYDPLFRL